MIDATGVQYDAVPYDLERRALPPHRRGPARRRRSRSCAATTRSSSARSARPRSRPASSSAACSSSCASSSTSSSTCARSPRRPSELNDGVDMIVIRENTEGTYAGEGGFLRHGTPHEVATQGSVNTRFGVERCIRYAFDLAQSRPRRHLTLVHKTNVLTFAGDLWQRAFNEVAAEYPDVTTGYDHIDAACIHFVQRPERYDVIVTDNLFGDILTDLGGAVAGGIGRAASANLNPARTGPSLFEPVHGSAPGHRGNRHRGPPGRDHQCRVAARVPRGVRGGGPGQEGGRGFRRCVGIDIGDRLTDRGKGLRACPSRRPRRSGWTASSSRGTRRTSTSSPTRSTTGWASSRASAPTRRARVRRSSGSPSTSSGCSTRRRS